MDICKYSWGYQYDPEDYSDLHECELKKGHAGPHIDGTEIYDPDADN